MKTLALFVVVSLGLLTLVFVRMERKPDERRSIRARLGERRATMIGRLREYREAGEFPHNYLVPGARPPCRPSVDLPSHGRFLSHATNRRSPSSIGTVGA